jgi:hypothetical protein
VVDQPLRLLELHVDLINQVEHELDVRQEPQADPALD